MDLSYKIKYEISDFEKSDSDPIDIFYEKKQLFVKDSESSLSVRESPEDFALHLAEYDVISFDIFDTLILRPVSKPTDLFYFVGGELDYLNFDRIRIEMEQKAREKKYKQFGTREVTFDEIWDEMECETGIPKKRGLVAEWKCEKQYCFANPYMLQVLEKLNEWKKTVIVISDMYFEENYIKELLNECGFPRFAGYFVSSSRRASKSEGTLFEIVKEKYGKTLRYTHCGDNEYSDVKQAKKHGFTAFYYPNVNEFGIQYRTEDMSAVTGSVYRGLVNSYIHNGLKSIASLMNMDLYTEEFLYWDIADGFMRMPKNIKLIRFYFYQGMEIF